MNVYLACTVRGDRSAVLALRGLCDRLEAAGHRVLTRHLLEDDVDAAEARLTERDVYERDIGWLDACDVLIADASGSSFGVGFEVGYVLGRGAGQTVILVYNEARRDTISRLIAGNAHPRCVTHGYRDAAELDAIVERAIALR